MTDKDKEDAKALLIKAGLDSEVAAVLLKCSTLECVKSEIAKILAKEKFKNESQTIANFLKEQPPKTTEGPKL